jgi:hypothetical protein
MATFDAIRAARLLRELADCLDPDGASHVAEPEFIDLAPRDAARVLGISATCLWARLRKAEGAAVARGKPVVLPGGATAYRVGRAWRVRVPRRSAAT